MYVRLFIALIYATLYSIGLGKEIVIERLVCERDQPCSCVSINKVDNTWKIDCSNSTLNTTLIATVVYRKYQIISFENNELTILKKNVLPVAHMNHTETLNFAYNKISQIEKGTFSTLTKLKVLNLKKNKLNTIDDGWFEGLDNLLEDLDLSDNEISILPSGAFRLLNSLKYLDLDGNRITFIKGRSFIGLIALQELSIDRNPLFLIDDDAFQPMSKSLETLSVIGSKLKQLPVLNNLSKLNKLVFDRNSFLGTIPQYAFKGAPNVSDISFDFMDSLQTIENCAFCGLPNLSFLRISDSPKVKTITKANFDPDFFNRSMDTVDFSNNNLTTLSYQLINWTSVSSIYLAGNKFDCTCDLLWMNENSDNLKDEPKCSTPSNLRGYVIRNLPKASFGNCNSYYHVSKLFVALAMLLVILGTMLITWYIWSSRKKEPGVGHTVFFIKPLSTQPYAYRNLAMNQEETEQVAPNKYVDYDEDDAPYPPFDNSNTKGHLV